MMSIVLRSTVELAMIILIIYGFAHEKDMIEIEQLLWKAIVVTYRRFKRNRELERMRKNREFRVVNGGKSAHTARASRSAESGTTFVA